MQISSNLFYSQASSRMNALSDRATTLQTQIATGKRVLSPTDDAVATQKIAQFDRQDAADGVYKTNLSLAGSLIGQADSALSSMATQVRHAIELTTKAGNGTLTDANRKTIAEELDSVLGTLVTLANSNDARGQPLFGTAAGMAAVEKRAAGYTFPETVVSEIPIADGQTIQATESARRVFQIGDPVTGTNTLDVLAKLTAALRDGGNVTDAVGEALDKLKTGNEQIATVQASLGVRATRIEMQQALQTTAANDRASLRSDIEDVDITSAITEMQQIMTVLQATQASFTKLSGLSLFDYLK